jgi:hypothetical protein
MDIGWQRKVSQGVQKLQHLLFSCPQKITEFESALSSDMQKMQVM